MDPGALNESFGYHLDSFCLSSFADNSDAVWTVRNFEAHDDDDDDDDDSDDKMISTSRTLIVYRSNCDIMISMSHDKNITCYMNNFQVVLDPGLVVDSVLD